MNNFYSFELKLKRHYVGDRRGVKTRSERTADCNTTNLPVVVREEQAFHFSTLIIDINLLPGNKIP